MEPVVESAEDINTQLLEQIEQQRRIIEEKDKTIGLLEEKIHYLLNQRFGSKSERFDDRQPSLFEAEPPPKEPEPTGTIPPRTYRTRPAGRRKAM